MIKKRKYMKNRLLHGHAKNTSTHVGKVKHRDEKIREGTGEKKNK